MSKQVSVRELREKIAAVLESVSDGEQVVITRRGRPVARIVPERQESPVRAARYPLRGSVRSMSRDFDEPIEGLWEAQSS